MTGDDLAALSSLLIDARNDRDTEERRARKAEAELEAVRKALTDLCEFIEAHWPFPITAEGRKVLEGIHE